MSPEAQGYLDSWLNRPPRSKDARYLKAYDDGSADRETADSRRIVSTRNQEMARARRKQQGHSPFRIKGQSS